MSLARDRRRLRNAVNAVLDRNAVLCSVIERLVDAMQGKKPLGKGDDLDEIRESARHCREEGIPAQRAYLDKELH